MASRTNKQGIAKKKAQQQKQASRLKGSKRFDYPKRKMDLTDGMERGVIWVYKNPKGGEYHRFIRGRKVCRETRLRVDPDGYRYTKTPSGWTEFVVAPISGRTKTKMRKSMRSR